MVHCTSAALLRRQQERSRFRRERAATLVEYALGVALILVPTLIAVDSLQSQARSNIATHGATAGAPDLPDAGIPASTSTTAAPPPAATSTTASSSVTANAQIVSQSEGTSGNRWSPRVDVRAADASTGSTLTGVTITVTWTENPSGTVTTQQCAVPSTGVCTFQLNNLSRKQSQAGFVDSVQLSVTAITSSSQTITYTSGSASTVLDPVNTGGSE